MSSSTRPLALASYAGLLFAAAGLILLIYALYPLLKGGQTPPGWTSLMIVVTVLGSVQLFVLGIIGQYLGRIHEQTRGRPLFIIDSVYRSGNSTGAAAAPPSAPAATPPQG